MFQHNLHHGEAPIATEISWTITIHKSPGFTISNAVIDLGPTEKVAGLVYVALSRVCKISDLILEQTTLEKN